VFQPAESGSGVSAGSKQRLLLLQVVPQQEKVGEKAYQRSRQRRQCRPSQTCSEIDLFVLERGGVFFF